MSLQFAYWAPNVSGGLVISNIPQKTEWSFEANSRYARIAKQVGFDYVLLQTRFFASYGAENQLEAATLASALAATTKKSTLLQQFFRGYGIPAYLLKLFRLLIISAADASL